MKMELREFYEFDFWPPESDRQVAAQLVAREVGALVAVRSIERNYRLQLQL